MESNGEVPLTLEWRRSVRFTL